MINRQEFSHSEEITPTDLFIALRSQGFVITGEEQDAHELVQGLLDVIESDRSNLETTSENPLQLFEDQTNTAVLTKFSKPGVALNRLGRHMRPFKSLSACPEDLFPFRGSTVTCVSNQKAERSPAKSLTFNITL